MAFKLAASMAFKEGVQKAGPVLLEPIMKVEVVAPEEFLGEVMGQINSRRGNIQGMEVRPGNAQAVRGMVRWLKCLVMLLNCVRLPKAAASFSMELTTMRLCRNQWRKKFSKRNCFVYR